MALLICLACTTAYAVGAPKCPHCQSPDRRLDWERPAEPPTAEIKRAPRPGKGA